MAASHEIEVENQNAECKKQQKLNWLSIYSSTTVTYV